MYSSKWNTDATKFLLDTISPCNWRVQRHNTMMIAQMKRMFNGQGSEDQDVWNHLFKEGVCEEVLPFIKIGPSRSGNLVPGRPMRGHHPPQETQDVHIYSSCIYFIFIGHSSIHIENVRSASFLVNVPGKRSRRPSVCRSVQVPLTMNKTFEFNGSFLIKYHWQTLYFWVKIHGLLVSHKRLYFVGKLVHIMNNLTPDPL